MTNYSNATDEGLVELIAKWEKERAEHVEMIAAIDKDITGWKAEQERRAGGAERGGEAIMETRHMEQFTEVQLKETKQQHETALNELQEGIKIHRRAIADIQDELAKREGRYEEAYKVATEFAALQNHPPPDRIFYNDDPNTTRHGWQVDYHGNIWGTYPTIDELLEVFKEMVAEKKNRHASD